MLKLKRLGILEELYTKKSKPMTESFLRNGRRHEEHIKDLLFLPQHRTAYRFLDIYQIGNKVAIEKERARLKDELNRGYFADISELKKHGGKISVANKIIIPAMVAVKFPDLEVNFSDGTSFKLPCGTNDNKVGAGEIGTSRPSLVCLSFRASSQVMIDSWTAPFSEAFKTSKDVRVYEVSLIDSWFLSLNPIKQLLLRVMRKSRTNGKDDGLHRQIVYSFGDHYYFRKSLNILNLLTGYVFLLDSFGRIRWHGSGLATQEELASLLSCTSLLLEENESAISKRPELGERGSEI